MQMSKYVRLTKGLNDKGILVEEDKVYDYIKTTEKYWYVYIRNISKMLLNLHCNSILKIIFHNKY